MNETVFYDSRGVTVTNARFVVPDHTFTIGGITSVRKSVQKPHRWMPILLIAWGGFSLLYNLSSGLWLADVIAVVPILIGLALLIGGIFLWRRQRKKYSVSLQTASGEKRVLVSEDEQFIDEVIWALNEAVIHRT